MIHTYCRKQELMVPSRRAEEDLGLTTMGAVASGGAPQRYRPQVLRRRAPMLVLCVAYFAMVSDVAHVRQHGELCRKAPFQNPERHTMSVADWFSTFCSNLVIRSTESISRRYKAITKRLNTDFRTTTSETANSLYVGSYGRNTAIAGFSDLDMIFELPYSEYLKYDGYSGNGQSALLQAVRSSIKKTYSVTNIGADGQVVVVPFDDGISFEVVPAFVNKDDSYTYPDANGGGSWRVTDPKPEIKAIHDRDASCNRNLVPLCRMMRAWKNQWSVPIGGLLVDTLAYQFIIGWGHKDKSYLYYDFLCRDFFDYMAVQDPDQEYWRSPGSAQYVYGKKLFQYKARRCHNLALAAISHDSKDEEWSAKQKWREIFGTNFPV